MVGSVFCDGLVGLAVKASATIAAGRGFNSCILCGEFSGSSHKHKNWHTSGYPVRRLTLCYNINAGT